MSGLSDSLILNAVIHYSSFQEALRLPLVCKKWKKASTNSVLCKIAYFEMRLLPPKIEMLQDLFFQLRDTQLRRMTAERTCALRLRNIRFKWIIGTLFMKSQIVLRGYLVVRRASEPCLRVAPAIEDIAVIRRRSIGSIPS